MTRIGLFGGAFDPIHNAHLNVAAHAVEALPLDQVLFMPSGGQPYYKFQHNPASPEHRLAMIKAAIQNNPNFSVSDYEIAQKQFCYTIETLRYLKQTNPPQSEIILLAGEDWRQRIPEWKHGDQLLHEFKVVYFARPVEQKKCKEEDSRQSEPVIEIPMMDISSTMIRERLQTGQGIEELVPHAVYEYIKKHDLYR
jgi:nicotinate-nucleotide adenylyltransferase